MLTFSSNFEWETVRIPTGLVDRGGAILPRPSCHHQYTILCVLTVEDFVTSELVYMLLKVWGCMVN